MCVPRTSAPETDSTASTRLSTTRGSRPSLKLGTHSTTRSMPFNTNPRRRPRARYAPREKIASHDHPANPTLYVYLRDSGPVRFVHLGAEQFTLTRPAVRAGGF